VESHRRLVLASRTPHLRAHRRGGDRTNSQDRKKSDEPRRFSPQNKKHDVSGKQKSKKKPNVYNSYTGRKKSKRESNDILLHLPSRTFRPDIPDPNLPTNTLNPHSNFLPNPQPVHPLNNIPTAPTAHTSRGA
jgi:hypothetical protein